MIVRVREWYVARSARERLLILLMLAIAAPLLAWLLVVQPLGRVYQEALDRHLEAVDRNGRVRALADAAGSAVRAPPASAARQELGLVVADAAARAGIALDSNSPAGPGTVSVAIGQAPPGAVMQWLREFEQSGIRIEELRIAPSGERTVSVSARLARSGG